MAVERLKDLEVRIRDVFEPFRAAIRSGEDLNADKKSYTDHLKVMDESFEKIIAILWGVLEDLGALYKAPSLAEARAMAIDVNNRLLAHCEADTNYLGEYGEGESIWDYMSNLLLDASHAKSSTRFKTPASFIEGLETEEINDYLRDLVIFYMSQFCLISMESGGNNQVYVPRFERCIVNYLSVVARRLDPEKQRSDLMDKRSFQPALQVQPKMLTVPNNKILLSNLYKEFIEFKTAKEGLKEKIKRTYDVYFSGILHFVGDVQIDLITKAKLRESLLSYGRLPIRTKKVYRGKSVAELALMTVPERDKVAPKTVEDVKKLVQGLFRFAVDKEYLPLSPALDLNLNLQIAKEKASFSRTEVATLLSAVIALDKKYVQRKWIVLLAAYTGARLGEIAQLRYSDFKMDNENKIRYILIAKDAGSVKTSNAIRQVPIHSKLIDLGLDLFMSNSQGSERLFPDYYLKSKKISAWFPSFMSGLGIPKNNDFAQSRTFHSLRHSFITESRAKSQAINLIQSIVGHEKTSAGQTDVYTGNYSLDKLKPVVESVVYL